MGEIADGFANAWRDSSVAGLPASGPHDPVKADIRALGAVIDRIVSAAQAGITTVSTTAARDTFYATEANRGKLVYVNNNNGSATDPANGVYEYVSGAARIAESFYQGVSTVVQPLVDKAEDAQAEAQAWAEGTLPGGAGTKSAKEYAADAAAFSAALRKTNTILRADTSLVPATDLSANTRVVGPPAPRKGRIKRVRIRFTNAGPVTIRVYNRTGGSDLIAVGQTFMQVGSPVVLTPPAAGWQTFDTDIPVEAGQFIGFTTDAGKVGQILASTAGYYDNYGVPAAGADPTNFTVNGVSTAFVFLIGFDVISDVVTADTFDAQAQKVATLEGTAPFFAPTLADIPAAAPGRQGVIGTDGPVWSDGVSYYQTSTNEPAAAAWTKIAGLVVRDGWEADFDPGNPGRRTLSGGGVAALADAKGKLAPLNAAANRPSLDTTIGNLPAMTVGAGGASPLRSSAFSSPLSGSYTVMFVSKADAVAGNQYLLDGITAGGRVAVMINAPNYRLFTAPGAGESGSVAADTNPHLYTVTVTPTGAKLMVDHAVVVQQQFATSTSPPTLTGLSVADRYESSGTYLRGKMGPVVVYRGAISDTAQLRMRKTLIEAAGLPAPALNIPAGQAVILGADDTGYYAKDADSKRNIASITKMMTLLVAWEKYLSTRDLNTPVTLTAADAVSNPDNGITLLAGDTVTLRELMYAAMLPSSNNAATALARLAGETLPGAGAPITKFLAAMSDKAAALGMVGTTWTNVFGGGTASARDAALLALAYADVPILATVGGTQSYTINVTGGNARTLIATSSFASAIPFLVCGKTGTGDNLFNLAVVCDLPDGSRCAFVALGAATMETRNSSVASMVDWRAWDTV